MFEIMRRIEFDAAHRVMRHESKCKNLHGHRYAAEIFVQDMSGLDSLGRVIDFSILKEKIGGWIDECWDHGVILNTEDRELIELCKRNKWKHYRMLSGNPTAENIAKELFGVAKLQLEQTQLLVTRVRIHETPNCYADYFEWTPEQLARTDDE